MVRRRLGLRSSDGTFDFVQVTKDNYRAVKRNKRKRRRRPRMKPALPLTEATSVDAEDDSGDISIYKLAAIAFGILGAFACASDMYSDVGLIGTLFIMPFAAAIFAVIGVVAVFLRGVISVFLVPAMILLLVGTIAHTIIWGSTADAEPDSVEQHVEAARST